MSLSKLLPVSFFTRTSLTEGFSLASKYFSCSLLVLLMAGCSQLSKKEPIASDADVLKQKENSRLEQQFIAALNMQREGQLEDAKEAYIEILEARPALINPRFNLAQIALLEEKNDDAEAALAEVLKQKPDHKQALNLKGVLARESGKFEASEAFYRQSLAADPSYLPAIRNLAILLDLYLGRLQEALPLYEQYQSMLDKPDSQVKDWIFDLKRRLEDGA